VSIIGMYLVLTLVFVGGLVLLSMAYRAYQDCVALESRGLPTTATIMDVRHEPRSGPDVIFAYNVNGVEYNGQADFEDKYGYEGSLKIKYLPENPAVGDPNPALRRYQAMVALIFMCVWNGLFIFVVVCSWWRNLKKKRAPKPA